ncbi:MAG: cytochrome c3 family protein [Acidobacteriota bacterium]|nr:cytochrome c3 family protein [Acidobacteriota bacterium]
MLLTGMLLSAQTRPAARIPTSVTAVPVNIDAGENYAGTDRCHSCHKAEFTEFGKTVHAAIPAHRGTVSGCEACHGGGKLHADAEEAAHGDDAKIAAAARLIFAFNANPGKNSARCLQCHDTSKQQSQFDHSTHATHGVGCNDCHSPHLTQAADDPKGERLPEAQAKFFSVPSLPEEARWISGSLLKKSQPDLCYECHGDVRAQFALPSHHRVPEGAMKCTDCHTPHGTSNRHELTQAGWETCTQCHAEKRGPYVFEHAAVKVEGCIACHTPHGSVNRQLLARREERMLCLQCHTAPAGVNVPHSRMSFQTRGTCTRCHSVIHGSNFDANFLH